MPVVKGGVWTNIEDEILKASVSKYGLNQWARVSSLLARKTAKQCKARWNEWLDPSIRKTEWSKEEDEKLLHLAKLMPTQWRTIAPIVGRTATQCLERYQKLLDEAEARENDEFGLGGPDGGETSAPTGDDVRRLRPGEVDPDPETKPARPDTIDMDEDEKEMLSEARARLANTQGKKAKRKARERQLEESRRLAVLQKRRELKNAGINIKITSTSKGQMDYNADVPFEKAPAAGFYDTLEEKSTNEREKEAFDPRKQQLARKRQGDQQEKDDPKRQRMEKEKSLAAAAARAGQMQKLREADQQSRRKALNLPAPQVSDAELEQIVKMGMAGDRAVKASGEDGSDERSLLSNYNGVVGATPLRTPRAPPQEDRIANEIRNIRALTETQSSLLGGENTPLHEGAGSTGFEGIAPRRNDIVTPNPMATPLRQPGVNGVNGVGATPLRTPRDHYALNEADQRSLVSQTPAEQKKADSLLRQSLRAKLASLPKPKAVEWEIEEDLPQTTDNVNDEISRQEDQEDIDRRERDAQKAAAEAEFKRQSSVYQRSLPRPKFVDYNALISQATSITDPIQALISAEAALLIAHDASNFPLPKSRITGNPLPLDPISDDLLAKARLELEAELNDDAAEKYRFSIDTHFRRLDTVNDLPDTLPPSCPEADYSTAFDAITTKLTTQATQATELENNLKKLQTGYLLRRNKLRQSIIEKFDECEDARDKLVAFRNLKIGEDAALGERLERLREMAGQVSRREREAQEEYRDAKARWGDVEVNGFQGT